jgi:hypothetical protein
MTKINQHTPGPLELEGRGNIWPADGSSDYPVADCGSHYNWKFASDLSVKEKASAQLLVAAYNQFDRAARALGVDAVELAEKIDLLKILKEWSSCNPNPLRENPLAPLVCEYGLSKHLHAHAVE